MRNHELGKRGTRIIMDISNTNEEEAIGKNGLSSFTIRNPPASPKGDQSWDLPRSYHGFFEGEEQKPERGGPRWIIGEDRD